MDILVKPNQLRESASVLRSSAKKIAQGFSVVDNQMQAVGPGKFSGYQADNIRQRYHSVRDLLLSSHDQIIKFANELDNIAKVFEVEDRKLAGVKDSTHRISLVDLITKGADLIGGFVQKIAEKLGYGWPPRLIPIPDEGLPRPPWDPKPVYAPGLDSEMPGDVTSSQETNEEANGLSEPSTEYLNINENATVGKSKCYSFVNDQRKHNSLDMPVGMAGKQGEGLYSGKYTGEGSFTDGRNTFTYGQEPKLGAIMLETPKNSPKNLGITFGHMSIISEIDKNESGAVTSFTISETSWGNDKSSVHNEVFTWNESSQRYVSKNGRMYDSFIY